MKKLKYFHNHKGITITELLIAMGLSSLVGLGVFQVMNSNDSMQKMFSQKMDDRIEANLADKLIMQDLRATGPSLNNIKFPDDNKLNFYDFDPDRSTVFYRTQKTVSRTVTLREGGTTTMYFLAFDDLRGKGLFADAVTFFQVGASPANMNQPASLTYRGINYNNYLMAQDSSGNYLNNPLLINTENLNKLVLVDSSSYMPTTPAKPAVFIGRIIKSGSIYDVQKIPLTSIPKYPSSIPIWDYKITTPIKSIVDPANFTEYMYNLPPVGANGASVRIKPVRLYRYSLECTTSAGCVLYRYDVLNGSSTQKIALMRGFECIRFTRSDIATSVFQVEMKKEKEKCD